jgi:hypothetical protein
VTTGDQADLPSGDEQIRALTEIVGTMAKALSRLSSRVDRLAGQPAVTNEQNANEPAAWAWSSPSTADENDPQAVVDNFVAFYNLTYVGVDGSKAKPIPPCWRDHPGLAMEVANLAYTWRTANLGNTANARDAQHWHHQWRPGFTDRLIREWVHTDCLDSQHRQM